jgi:hypothetical protein
MSQTPPKVLWIDEDYWEHVPVGWSVAQCGAVLQLALTVEDGIAILEKTRPDCQPAAIILDVIVRSALNEKTRPRFSGLEVWDRLDQRRRARTLVLSVVPYERFAPEHGIRPDQFFWKIELDKHMQEFEDRLRAILQKGDE